MIYGVSIYDKHRKLIKEISSMSLQQRHWNEFYKSEKSSKRSFRERIKSEQQELLRNHHKINNLIDELHCKEDSNG